MKKIVFTLAAVTVVCACGLVIDPDKLIEGNSATNGGPDATDTPDTSTSDIDGSNPAGDAAVDAPEGGVITVDVPECVPQKPTGAEGPYAVVIAPANLAQPACPAGYLATPVAVAKTDFASTSAVCGDSSGCICNASAGTVTCGLLVRSFDDSQCTKVADVAEAVGTTCKSIDSENYYKLEYAVGGFTCSLSGGTATPTAKPTPSYATQFVVCSPDPSVQLAQCKGGETPLPQAANAAACIAVPVNQSCSTTGYGAVRLLSKSGTFTDNRSCACGCDRSQAACTGGTVTTYDDDFGCTANPSALDFGVCRARNSAENVIGVAPTPASASCTAKATPSGEASPTIDMKLCCLGSGGGG
jgi:hypothetical protein